MQRLYLRAMVEYGDYVLYSDAQAALAEKDREIASLKAEVKRLEDVLCVPFQALVIRYDKEKGRVLTKKEEVMGDVIRVVEVAVNGVSFVDADISATLEALAGYDDNKVYTVVFYEMNKKDYEALPEFTGF